MPKLPIRIATAKRAVSREEYEAAKKGLPAPQTPGRAVAFPGGGRMAVAVSDQQVARVISDFQSDTQEILNSPDPLLARLTIFILAAMVITALVWASVARIDRVVAVRGKMVSTVPGLVVQPLDTAIIKSIDVKAGDTVKAGATLATLDPTFTEADVAQLQTRIESLNAQISRLEAEYNSRPFAIPAGKEDSLPYSLQMRIWSERQSQYEAQIRNYTQKRASLETEIKAREQELVQLQAREKIASELLNMRRILEEGQVGTKERTLRQTQETLDIRRAVVTTQASIQQNSHDLESLEAEQDVYTKQWATRISEELVTRRDERSSLLEQLSKAQKRLDLVRLETPVDAIVLEIAPRSVGSVISSAEPLFKLVPLNAPLEVDVSIPTKDNGYVQIGDPVEIKLDAYSFMEHGVLKGKLIRVSPDTFEERVGMDVMSVYKGRIELLTTTLETPPANFHLTPGMSLSAEIKIGERTVLHYFLRPVMRGMQEGLREP